MAGRLQKELQATQAPRGYETTVYFPAYGGACFLAFVTPPVLKDAASRNMKIRSLEITSKE